jgi:hypothetical protein
MCDECYTNYWAHTETNSDRCVKLILTEIFTQLTEEERSHTWVSATAHTTDNSLKAWGGGGCGNIAIIRGLWPACSPDPTSCDFYLWNNLEDEVYRMNLHTEKQ